MKKYVLSLLAVLSIATTLTFTACNDKGGDGGDHTGDGKYQYETVEGDPMKTRIYTLDNGLKVYLSVYKDEPRIQTFIAVRTGSANDPAETTGLAHYLEHMLFKGTSTLATVNWEEEKVLLDAISQKYEEHKAATDPAEKKAIYAVIDSLSYEASKLAVPNEYDKLVSALGAKYTNAWTSNEETVYMNDIPSNELEKWVKLESERFSELVLRLFHTELETVYEEFNRNQDNDGRWSWQNVMTGLLPNHPYGTQTTIGEGEHLKNPSMVNIHNYFDTYYKPNNVAICLSGDLDPDATIAMIDKYWGDWEPADIPERVNEPRPELTEPVELETFGQQEEHVYVGFAMDGAGSKDALMLSLVDMLLSNQQAGIIDINLVQKQQVLEAYCYPYVLPDHSIHFFYGRPRQGQTLEEVKDLLLAQIEKVKAGDFEEWMLDAVVKNLKLNEMQSQEENYSRAMSYVDAFILGVDWEDKVTELDRLDEITKEEVVAWANEVYGNGYAISYKRIGEDDSRHKVDKPVITAVEVNRDTASSFYTEIAEMESGRLEPVFVDYENDIQKDELESGVPMYYVENELNSTFQLYYIFDMGSDNDKELALAIQYMPYLGTEQYSAEQLSMEFYKLGISFDVSADAKQVYVQLSGLEESLEEGIELFEHILASVKADQGVYDGLASDILKEREDAKLNKNVILRQGIYNWAKYGPENPTTNRLSQSELLNMDVEELTTKIHELTSYKHRVFYFGQKDMGEVADLLNEHHDVPAELKDYPEATDYEELAMNDNKVYFVDYDMVQAEVLLVSKDEMYNSGFAAKVNVFNEYFGSGLSSIVFQEIREKKALAYSAYSYFSTPRYADEPHYVIAYVGSQADKMEEAISAMLDLMNDMPEAPEQFDAAKDAAMKKIETDYVTRSAKYWNWEAAQRLGLDSDIRKQIYGELGNMTMEDLKGFFGDHIAGRNYAVCVIGNKENVDLDALRALGDFEELSLAEIFGEVNEPVVQ